MMQHEFMQLYCCILDRLKTLSVFAKSTGPRRSFRQRVKLIVNRLSSLSVRFWGKDEDALTVLANATVDRVKQATNIWTHEADRISYVVPVDLRDSHAVDFGVEVLLTRYHRLTPDVDSL